MSDIKDMQEKFSIFVKERDWEQFHNPKDLAISLSLEANELLEHFQWKTNEELSVILENHRDKIADEVADVMHYLIAFANASGIDLYQEFLKKLEKNRIRFPKEVVKGKAPSRKK